MLAQSRALGLKGSLPGDFASQLAALKSSLPPDITNQLALLQNFQTTMEDFEAGDKRSSTPENVGVRYFLNEVIQCMMLILNKSNRYSLKEVNLRNCFL